MFSLIVLIMVAHFTAYYFSFWTSLRVQRALKRQQASGNRSSRLMVLLIQIMSMEGLIWMAIVTTEIYVLGTDFVIKNLRVATQIYIAGNLVLMGPAIVLFASLAFDGYFFFSVAREKHIPLDVACYAFVKRGPGWFPTGCMLVLDEIEESTPEGYKRRMRIMAKMVALIVIATCANLYTALLLL
jgi:hypothetical protein